MEPVRGTIAIMGSGEITDSMVRVHRLLLSHLPPPVKAVFIDTPAGFQMNADDLFEKAKEYFQKRLNQPLERVSFKSSKEISVYEAERAYQTLREADYIFVGPGSPTYALRNWKGTPIPDIIAERIKKGACFIAASAAALTLGSFTLPVYEIYKVGEELHWEEGLNLLGTFELPLVVIPHWNNAEGGTHDTRFCYMGEPRLIQLRSLLPPETPILGVDEHTACVVDFASGQMVVKGIGGITILHGQTRRTLRDGESFPLKEFRNYLPFPKTETSAGSESVETPGPLSNLDEEVRSLQASFESRLSENKRDALIEILLEMEKKIFRSYRNFQDEEQVSRAREAMRGMIVQLGLGSDSGARSLVPLLMEVLLEIRENFRSAQEWKWADSIREKLFHAGILVEDTPEGPRWHLKETG